jgi:hypothetical protein
MTPLRGRVELTVFSPVLSMSRCHRALMVHASVDQPGVTERQNEQPGPLPIRSLVHTGCRRLGLLEHVDVTGSTQHELVNRLVS